MKIPLDKIEDMLEQAGYVKATQDEGNDLWYSWWQNDSETDRAICIVTSKDSPTTWYTLMIEGWSDDRAATKLWDLINSPVYQ